MDTTGTVRQWSNIDGWGVIDSPDTPGGCWAHTSSVHTADKWPDPPVGEQVGLEYEAAEQDGYRFCASLVWPADEPKPSDNGHAVSDSGAYYSDLTITWDAPDESHGP